MDQKVSRLNVVSTKVKNKKYVWIVWKICLRERIQMADRNVWISRTLRRGKGNIGYNGINLSRVGGNHPQCWHSCASRSGWLPAPWAAAGGRPRPGCAARCGPPCRSPAAASPPPSRYYRSTQIDCKYICYLRPIPEFHSRENYNVITLFYCRCM